MRRAIPPAIAQLGIDEIYIIDAEFRPCDPLAYARFELDPGLAPIRFEPVCMTAKRWTTGEVSRSWYKQGDPCPWFFGQNVLVICYQAAADMQYFAAAGWVMPFNILDLYPEYRLVVNGRFDRSGKQVGADDHKKGEGRKRYGLLAALLHYGLVARTATEKQSNRKRILQGAPYAPDECQEIFDYNAGDVEDTERLFEAMIAQGDLKNIGQAMIRGDATRGFAIRDLNGMPLDCQLYFRLHRVWKQIRAATIRTIETRRQYGVFRFHADGTAHFDQKAAAALVIRRGLADIWPRTPTGQFSFADPDRGPAHTKVLKQMAAIDPYLEDLREGKRLIDRTNMMNLPVGRDGRCHSRYLPWVQKTGRSSPGIGALFAMSKWVRFLCKPDLGRGVAYIDLKSAEFGIAAALSHDLVMQQNYRAMLDGQIECVYFELAKRSGQVPADARVKDYRALRSRWKTACLALMYGQTPEGLASSQGITLSEARIIHLAFKSRYATYWTWTACQVVHAHVRGSIETVAGWRMEVNDYVQDRTLFNFHPQGVCGDIMRRAIALMADRGIAICEIVHDAVLIEAPAESLAEAIELTKACWREASREILGFELDAGSDQCVYPERFEDEDGRPMWDTILALLDEVERHEVGLWSARR